MEKRCTNIGNMKADPIVPGPGTYRNIRVISIDAKKYTLAPKTKLMDTEAIAIKKGVPGPGSYEDNLSFKDKGKYCVSTYNNSKASNFSTGRRFLPMQKHLLGIPGPGSYDAIGDVSKSI